MQLYKSDISSDLTSQSILENDFATSYSDLLG